MKIVRTAKFNIGFAIALVVVSIWGIGTYINTRQLIESQEWVTHTHQVMEGLWDILSTLQDAEVGQRGFILTGKEGYLEPYNQAAGNISRRIEAVTELTKDNAEQQIALGRLRALTDSKLDELKQTISLRRQSGLEATKTVIGSDRGKIIMDRIRTLVSQMQRCEKELLQSRQKAADSTVLRTMWTIGGGIPLLLLALTIAAIILLRKDPLSNFIAGLPENTSGWQKIAARYLFALIAVVLASLLRVWLLKLGPMPLFITYYPAVLSVAIIAGGGPGILAAALSGLIALYYFIPPYETFSIGSTSDGVALMIFTVTNLSLCLVAERLRQSRWAEAFGLAKQQETEELASKNEELAQQSEELSQQSEELAQQNEELQSQSEEILTLNNELARREDMLRKLLEATRLSSSEESVLTDICETAKALFGAPAAAVVVCERQESRLLIRAHSGFSEALKSWPLENSLISIALCEGRTVCLNDASLRTDVKLLPTTEPFQAALSAPLRISGEAFGAVTVYSLQKWEWTEEQFRLVEWFATQCGHILETLRFQEQLRLTAGLKSQLAAIVESSDDAIFSVNLAGTIQTWNSGAEQLFGYRPQEVIGKSITLLLPSDRLGEEEDILGHIRASEKVDHRETVRVTRDGRHLDVMITASPLKDQSGQVVGASKIARDISERKRTEEVLKRSHADLELRVQERTAELSRTVQMLHERSEQLQRMTTKLALSEQHERQRLSQILHDGLQQILVGVKLRIAIIGRSENIQRATEEVAALVDEAISTSRSLSAELSPPILLQGNICAALEWLARSMYEKHKLRVSLTAGDKIPPLAEGVHHLLFQAARELLFNVVKHSGVEEARIEVNQLDGHIQLIVEDEGAGFDPDQLHAEGIQPIGIGLFGIRERLSCIGGSMEIHSVPGQGSRFKLIAPRSTRSSKQDHPFEESPTPVSVAIASQSEFKPDGEEKKIRIILVDDHTVVRQGLARLLCAEPDFDIVGEASDGLSALSLVRELQPDVVVMDINMTGMDGIQATRIIHEELPRIHIIGLSMSHEREHELAMLEAGARRHLAKSGPSQTVIETIRAWANPTQ